MIYVIMSLLFWLGFRYYLHKSKHFWFDGNYIHHYDFLAFCSTWIACYPAHPIVSTMLSVICIIIALDDIFQHYMQKKLNDQNYDSPLKKLTYPIWILYFK